MSHSNIKPAQLSIRSFFQPKGPQYAPPPSKIANFLNPSPPAAVAPSAAAPPVSTPLPARDDEPAPSAAATSAIPPLPASLPCEACIRLVTRDDLNALRRINALLLPVSYSDSFYQHAVNPVTGRFSRVITWAHDGSEPKVVGGVVCQIEPKLNAAEPDNDHVPHNIYIQSLCLLSPYRSLGLVNAAVDSIVATAVADPTLGVTTLTAHVWTENEEGLKWYQARGFQHEEQPIRGYYMKLRPDSAWLVTRPVAASVRNSLPSKSSTPSRSTAILSTTAAVLNLPAESGPPRASGAPPMPRGQSYQNQRADTEWNDLPQDMATGRLTAPPRASTSATGSSSSSRNSSTARKKRDRSYPAAAFGGQDN
ncbi:hypothetical protein B0J13DRAFT_172477 [Dactylonectria estremocensis]|uniref:N-acetyltransferase domain-containing protein n=1 Tax=Dactylonectria estremocensis TaxID=1079267 RepID=A0A9P9JB36_9HYPO|nr:hypothetical protein B0J13DRAFT_172477 [Dactylonectria estremocensis]